jgi:hypothetical protein
VILRATLFQKLLRVFLYLYSVPVEPAVNILHATCTAAKILFFVADKGLSLGQTLFSMTVDKHTGLCRCGCGHMQEQLFTCTGYGYALRVWVDLMNFLGTGK